MNRPRFEGQRHHAADADSNAPCIFSERGVTGDYQRFIANVAVAAQGSTISSFKVVLMALDSEELLVFFFWGGYLGSGEVVFKTTPFERGSSGVLLSRSLNARGCPRWFQGGMDYWLIHGVELCIILLFQFGVWHFPISGEFSPRLQPLRFFFSILRLFLPLLCSWSSTTEIGDCPLCSSHGRCWDVQCLPRLSWQDHYIAWTIINDHQHQLSSMFINYFPKLSN